MTRLNAYLARSGVASRREADRLIASGVVRVNGRAAPPEGVLVDPDHDRVTVDGKPVKPVTRHRYIALNKPLGVITTARDESGRTSVLDVVGDEGRAGHRLFPVGRLDADSTGLLLLTDDGVTKPAQAEVLRVLPGPMTELRIVLGEGRHRQVRRMLLAVGYRVQSLRRAGFGPLKLGRLKVGGWRVLVEAEVSALRHATRLQP